MNSQHFHIIICHFFFRNLKINKAFLKILSTITKIEIELNGTYLILWENQENSYLEYIEYMKY